MKNYKIAKPSNGVLAISLRPCPELIRSREEIKNRLDEAVRVKRIAGYDVACYMRGRIALFYNELVDEDGKAANYVAKEVVNAIYAE